MVMPATRQKIKWRFLSLRFRVGFMLKKAFTAMFDIHTCVHVFSTVFSVLHSIQVFIYINVIVRAPRMKRSFWIIHVSRRCRLRQDNRWFFSSVLDSIIIQLLPDTHTHTSASFFS